MVEVATREAPVRAERSGSFGRLRSEDATALAMVVTELVHNAIKHGLARTGGVVTVRAVRSRDEHDELLTVTVTDDGSGLRTGSTRPHPAWAPRSSPRWSRTCADGSPGAARSRTEPLCGSSRGFGRSGPSNTSRPGCSPDG